MTRHGSAVTIKAMKRNWNWPIWLGFILALAGVFTYPFFVQYPITRDFPWANLVLFGTGALLLVFGLFRAFGKPQVYRGKIFGSIFAFISLCLFGFFAYEIFYMVRQVPLSAQAPRVGERAPEFTLPDQNGKGISLADLLSSNGAVLIFYRGHW
jgi:hypothetical protein